MRKNILKVLFFAMTIASFNACNKDEEVDPVVTATDRDKFLGTWVTQSIGTSGTQSFTMTISIGSSSPAQILIKNFENEGASTTTIAEISGSSISIPQQVVGPDTIQGSGTYNGNNTLSLSYTLRDGISVDTRTATAHK